MLTKHLFKRYNNSTKEEGKKRKIENKKIMIIIKKNRKMKSPKTCAYLTDIPGDIPSPSVAISCRVFCIKITSQYSHNGFSLKLLKKEKKSPINPLIPMCILTPKKTTEKKINIQTFPTGTKCRESIQ